MDYTRLNIKKEKVPMILFKTDLYLLQKKIVFFQYPILHISTLQALIKGCGRSKSDMNFPSNK